MVGRALGSQRFFHDVGYEHRLLDSVEELYHFEESNFVNKSNNNINTLSSNNYPDDLLLHYCDSPTTISHGTATASNSSINNLYTPHPGDDIPSSKQPTAPFPNGVMTDLTYCYSSTCHGNSPCYSYSCPKRRSVKVSKHLYLHNLPFVSYPYWKVIRFINLFIYFILFYFFSGPITIIKYYILKNILFGQIWSQNQNTTLSPNKNENDKKGYMNWFILKQTMSRI